MTKKEYVDRNIGLTFDFIRGLVDHPEAREAIPNVSELDFIEKDLSPKIFFSSQKGENCTIQSGAGFRTGQPINLINQVGY